jgi:ubiquinone/menaquinone biosynthesis C-methylase UbiE
LIRVIEQINFQYQKWQSRKSNLVFKQKKLNVKLKDLSILDWGCGTGRFLRHLPTILDSSNSFCGTDYNKKYVKWCSENLDEIKFKNNSLLPPLDFKADSMAVIYGISIFIHLSEELHFSWIHELTRV